MTPFQALQTATVNAAQALGLGDELGTIQPGKIADLAFVGGDPLLDIRNTRDVKRVMKGGRRLHGRRAHDEINRGDIVSDDQNYASRVGELCG